MGGHDRQIQQLIQQNLQLVPIHALLFQAQQGIVKRAGPIMAAAFGLPPPQTQVEGFLGDVQQAEIVVEDTDQLTRGVRVQIVQCVHELLAPQGRAFAQDIDEASLQLVDQSGYFRPSLNLEDTGQYRVQQPQGTA